MPCGGMRRLAVIVGAALLVAGPAAGARKPRPQPCPGGTFLVSWGSDALGTGHPPLGVVTIGANTVTLGDCGVTPAHSHVTRRATSMRARWTACGVLGPIRLRARMRAPACEQFAATIRVGRGHRHQFGAFRTAPIVAGDDGPIDAPAETWAWAPVASSVCANGSPTGIGVNVTSRSRRLVIFLMGGGACWDASTCYVAHLADNIESGYGLGNFTGDTNFLLRSSGLFDRADPRNPFRDWSWVFVPYCTGDVHAGDSVNDFGGRPTHQVGAVNVANALRRLVATFPEPERVVISGSSAGGFGAAYHWSRVAAAFAPARVDLIDDSGPPLPPPYGNPALVQIWFGTWKVAFPTDCAACGTRLDALPDYDGPLYPASRAAFLDYTHDPVIDGFFLLSDTADALTALATGTLSRWPNYRWFFVNGASHVLLTNPAGITQNGVTLLDWLGTMESDDPGWVSVQP